MLCNQTMVIPTGMAQALQHFNGEWTQEEIATNLKAPPEAIAALVSKLDELGLLWGPTATELEQQMLARLHEDGTLPLRQSRMLGESPEACRTQLEAWLGESEDPELPFDPIGLCVPRMDYAATSEIYAGVYHAILGASFDRVLVLDYCQIGLGDGVVGTPLGFQSPFGRLEPDTAFIEALTDRVGDSFMEDELDHLAAHGIEMQIPWIQRCLGTPRIIGVLVPDPLASFDQDGGRVSTAAFTEAAREVIAASEGKTLVIATGDLSHVGPQFGEPRAIDDQRLAEADRADRELLGTFAKGDADAFVSAVKWNANANRWSGVGPMAAMLDILQPGVIELIDYQQHALDETNNAVVASAGLALGT
jgi:AmmeMemoRadiSam system protein B